MDTNRASEELFDPTRRQLCPDGSCIGVLDDSGRCRTCGRTASGDLGPGTFTFAEEPAENDLTAEAGTTFDSSRRLCSDGACVGLIGDDARCKVCGRPAEEVF